MTAGFSWGNTKNRSGRDGSGGIGEAETLASLWLGDSSTRFRLARELKPKRQLKKLPMRCDAEAWLYTSLPAPSPSVFERDSTVMLDVMGEETRAPLTSMASNRLSSRASSSPPATGDASDPGAMYDPIVFAAA